MADGGDKLRFALDHNFPGPVLAAFAAMMPTVELVPISHIQDLAELDDWELFSPSTVTKSPGTGS